MEDIPLAKSPSRAFSFWARVKFMPHNEKYPLYNTKEIQMNIKDQLATAAPIARKTGPWVGVALMSLIALNDLRTAKKS